ncbi:polysaccharide deacetylase family protein [Jannaschia sp. 2305UL9-9]|uniref:polysaccharide deacetylase family protein n=1 Tax=Jannaschia sp. 2305UL9-9 TaxID=3121638 RepID=UPI003528A3DF
MSRDLIGYGATPPDIVWPNGARVAVSLVVNVEEGAERSLLDGDERNESVYEAREEVIGAADPCMTSHFGYGPRRGYWRIAETLDAFEAKATFSTCGRAAEATPWLIRDVVARGHEVSCHGWRWETHAGMDEASERQIITRTHDAIERIAGVAPSGWHTRSASTVNTRRLLIEHGGFDYDSDAYDDDLPYLVAGSQDRPHVILPYAFDTNDMRFQPGGGFITAEDFSGYCLAAYDRLLTEGRGAMMSVGLHLRLIGKPARIDGLRQFLDGVKARGGAWIAPRRDIAAHWRTVSGR